MSTRERSQMRAPADFVAEFAAITGLRPAFDQEYAAELERLVEYLSSRNLRSLQERKREFLAHVNWKFRLNGAALAKFYGDAAREGYTFNYPQKCSIQRAFDLHDRSPLVDVLTQRAIPVEVQRRLLQTFNPVDEKLTLEHLRSECKAPTKLRKEKGDREIEGEIIKAQFSSFLWVSLPEKEMHRFFDPNFSPKGYRSSFWEELHSRASHLFSRSGALHVIRIDRRTIKGLSDANDVRNAICHQIEKIYPAVNNYGFIAVLIDPLRLNDRNIEWEIAADITLFCEKHRESTLKKAYFRWDRVRDETVQHIGNIDIAAAHFELVNEGFSYRDCFVLTSGHERIERILLVFQKNERDETPIPCPTCRSTNVQGNSYPLLGVRSWECNNVLCPDRSKYNRGKRYAFRSLAMQQAIDDPRNEIPVTSVRRWSRDVVHEASEAELCDMLTRHYSMHGDVIHTYNWPAFEATELGRSAIHHSLRLTPKQHRFWDGPLFKRYACAFTTKPAPFRTLGRGLLKVLVGDSASVLSTLGSATFDGAVTSPPYYNAREYAQWPNMYCYMHDMIKVNSEVYRTLKPGALYMYNIFDYFDNENTVVFSAMGQRRMILSAYTVDAFRRIGFELLGNVVWDKGEIEGKRGFNAGNYSPYYQAPFNCWEHILIFRKPGKSGAKDQAERSGAAESLVGRVLSHKPVLKMVKGENVHGHSAPFPDAIPELLVSHMRPGSVVLDPFAGSLTTGRVAERYGVNSVCIERSEEYCELGLRMQKMSQAHTDARRTQLSLFQQSGDSRRR